MKRHENFKKSEKEIENMKAHTSKDGYQKGKRA